MRRLGQALRRLTVALRTIRVRLTLWYVALLALILLAFCAILYFTLSQSVHAEADRGLMVEARQVIATLDIENGRPTFDTALLPGTMVALYEPNGGGLIASNGREPPSIQPEALAAAVAGHELFSTIRAYDGGEWRVMTLPIADNGRLTGVLQVARSEQDVDTVLGRLALLMSVAVPFTLLVAIAGGLFMAGRALGPIDRMTRAAESIGAEDLSRRLALPPSPDEIGRLAATFDRMLDRLDRAFQRQRQFTADASHELRTPLALLASQADVALDRPRKAHEYREVLASIRDDAAGMGQLLHQLLTLARADSGQESMVREPVALDALAHAVVESMTPLADMRHVRLTAVIDAPVTVEGDQTRLTQLAINLIDNGLKFTPPGGIVTLSVARLNGCAALRVTDTGVGIASEHLPHLFERFYRADAARAREDGGTGLGLSICEWIARAHGGEIAVESRPGQGTTFVVRLPFRVEPPPRDGA